MGRALSMPLSITRLSILRLKLYGYEVVIKKRGALNNKTLNSEIETDGIQGDADGKAETLNNKTLNSEIETGEGNLGITYSQITLNNKTLNSEIETSTWKPMNSPFLVSQ